MPLPTTARTARAANAGVVLRFRDRLRIEFDGYFRDALIRISGSCDTLPSPAWKEMRRDDSRATRPQALLLRAIDQACLAGANEDTLLELPALLSAYIYARRAQLDLTPAEAVVAIPEPLRKAA